MVMSKEKGTLTSFGLQGVMQGICLTYVSDCWLTKDKVHVCFSSIPFNKAYSLPEIVTTELLISMVRHEDIRTQGHMRLPEVLSSRVSSQRPSLGSTSKNKYLGILGCGVPGLVSLAGLSGLLPEIKGLCEGLQEAVPTSEKKGRLIYEVWL